MALPRPQEFNQGFDENGVREYKLQQKERSGPPLVPHETMAQLKKIEKKLHTGKITPKDIEFLKQVISAQLVSMPGGGIEPEPDFAEKDRIKKIRNRFNLD
ncbi:hypothetical protein A2300_02805 [Candidatus Falkowbacteria bacterium RIFOXYB2_FULL_35_7]|uniref:Uncharacterized protein n=1 Tax=Candidatus Falkowbacteria bacterium RIFOXYC2_FULL_36_12 TaxID=1798002 RepID=A0A1F5SZ14_9BACT|nr:MAG: hypothetical protein A2300_02805 [Candidatus Falkowbacteria bacterium RIFOXYB2_FULL_35_7]OGF31726.1 MAG: hypothetical protein A2478_04545 [Candidatus Falkowbacteria bacterium RIFOXYC2_FULL_36_12]